MDKHESAGSEARSRRCGTRPVQAAATGRLRRDRELTELAVRFRGRARGKEQLRAQVYRSHVRTELQGPEAVDGQRGTGGVGELAQQLAAGRVIGVDQAVTEVADEQGAGKSAPACRSQRDAPG